jgi:glycine/D-amino acid oxidase-like deaminating enzyme
MNKGEAILQRAPLAKNVIVAAGHSSNGILLSPLVAQEILELVANG